MAMYIMGLLNWSLELMYVFIFIPKKNIVIPLIHSDHVIAIDSDMITISSILQPRENIYINPM